MASVSVSCPDTCSSLPSGPTSLCCSIHDVLISRYRNDDKGWTTLADDTILTPVHRLSAAQLVLSQSLLIFNFSRAGSLFLLVGVAIASSSVAATDLTSSSAGASENFGRHQQQIFEFQSESWVSLTCFHQEQALQCRPTS